MVLTIFSRLSLYIAAVVIFISWVISNSFVTAREEDAQNMDAVQSQQTQVRQFSFAVFNASISGRAP